MYTSQHVTDKTIYVLYRKKLDGNDSCLEMHNYSLVSKYSGRHPSNMWDSNSQQVS